jgi:hypothetical protein
VLPPSVVSSKVQVTNPVWNGISAIRRKEADFYVAEGRALWVGDAIRLVDSHPKNVSAAARAVSWQDELAATDNGWAVFDGLRKYGPPGSPGQRTSSPRAITDERAAAFVRHTDRETGIWRGPNSPTDRLAVKRHQDTARANAKAPHDQALISYEKRDKFRDVGPVDNRPMKNPARE